MTGVTLATRVLTGLALAFALSTGCSQQASVVSGNGPASTTSAQNGPGAVTIGLVVPPSFQVNTIGYQLTKPGYSQAGALDVSKSGGFSATLGGIPSGTGYTLALTAVDTSGKFTSCAGSAPVSVTGGATTSVTVNIDCHLPQPSLTPTAVPVPPSAVALLAVALLGAGALSIGRRTARRP
ncbi:MAG TPA: hypothetical protein VKZ18_27990 [Polyangia bacterium]|nr:hypothetical protein [Polyangia bacterium]